MSINNYKIDQYQRKILAELFSATGPALAFTIFRRTKFEKSLFLKKIISLQKNQLITAVDTTIEITESGKQALLSQPMHHQPIKPWRQVPQRFLRNKISPNEPYIPSLKLMAQGSN